MRRANRIRRPLLLVAWSWLLVACFIDLDTPGDYTGFVAFGRAANEGSLAYDPAVQARLATDGLGSHWATWPPGFVPLASLLARVDAVAHAPAVVLFQLTNLALLGVALYVFATWLAGPGSSARVPGREAADAGSVVLRGFDTLPVAVGLLVPFRLVLSNFEHAQVNLVVLGLVLAGFYLLERRPWAGGLLFGIGSAIKATPILLLPYLVWRRRWKALGCAFVGVAVAWIGLPALWLGPDGMFEWWRAWIEALPVAGQQVGWMNQSLRSIAVLQFGSESGIALWVAAAGVLALAILLVFGRPMRRAGERRTAVEIALLLAAITIVSPVSWKAHYVTLVPLCAATYVLGRAGLEGPASTGTRRFASAVLWIAAVGINFSSPEIIGREATRSLEGHGLILGLAGLLTASALWLLHRSGADLRP